MRLAVVLLCLGACRLGFDSIVDGAIDPTGSVVRRFGETPAADFKNVTADTYLYNEAPQDTYNYGASMSLSLEGTEKRALLRFDVTAIPSGKMIVSARLQIFFTTTSTSTVTIAPLVEAWIEGTSNGAAGIANYSQRTSTQMWTTPGGTAGAQVASFQSNANAVGVDLPASVVQSWVDMPPTNFGVRISGGASDVTFSSSEAVTAENRPELVVTYLP